MKARELYQEIEMYIKNGKKCFVASALKRDKGSVHDQIERVIFEKENQACAWLEEKSKCSVTYIEKYVPKERLIILGGGHIALPLVAMSHMLDFEVILVDDRPSFANKERFPGVTKVICDNFTKAIDQIGPRESDYIVIITRGHKHDGVCLKALFQYEEAGYTGMIGSRRRVRGLKDMLIEEEGLEPERLERVHTPIGLSIGAVTPSEIAISILSEIIQVRRKNEDKHQVMENALQDEDVWRELLTHSQEKKTGDSGFCVVTIIDTKGSVPRNKGAKMIVYPDGRIKGSIGGGCSEGAILLKARRMIRSGNFRVESIDMTGEVAESDGMVCGGFMYVLLEDYS